MAEKVGRDPRFRIVALVVIVVLALLGKWLEPYLPASNDDQRNRSTAPGEVVDEGVQEVLRVVDGDTLLLKKNRRRVRLQGIDTPETVKENTPVQKWGPEASAYTKQFVAEADGKLRFTIDGEREDQYGRALRFVWNGDRLLNEELIANGLARAKLAYDYSQEMKDRFRRAQDQARRQRLGIWSD